MSNFFRFPVPTEPPNGGSPITVQFNIEWLPIVTALLLGLKNPAMWENPPDDISNQVDELINLISTNLD